MVKNENKVRTVKSAARIIRHGIASCAAVILISSSVSGVNAETHHDYENWIYRTHNNYIMPAPTDYRLTSNPHVVRPL